MDLRSEFELGAWTIRPLLGEFVSGELTRRVQPKAMDVLLELAKQAPHAVEREALVSAVWGERAVSDEPLTRCIGELRRALDDGTGAAYIGTIPKRGYRLLIPPVPLAAAAESDRPGTGARRSRARIAGVAGIVILALALAVFLGSRPRDSQVADTSATANARASARAIAVLPFSDLSPAGDQRYFADGLAEELMGLLARSRSMRVVARRSAFRFRDRDDSIQEIGAALDVAHVLDGSVRKSADRVRISVELVDTASGFQVWSEDYDRRLGEIFSVQSEIATAIARELAVEVSEFELSARSDAVDPLAWDMLLRARYLSELNTDEDFERALGHLRDAIALEPGFSDAWSLMAVINANRAMHGMLDRDEGFALARQAAEQAIRVEPEFSGGHLALGQVRLVYDWDIDAASEAIQRAYALAPGNAAVMQTMAYLSSAQGRVGEAIELLESAKSRDPLNAVVNNNLAVDYFYAGRFDESEREFTRLLDASPNYGGARIGLGKVYLLRGQAERALQLMSEEPFEPWRLSGLPLVLYALERHEEADRVLDELVRKYRDEAPSQIAENYAWRGDVDRAFSWLQHAYEVRDSGVTSLKVNPFFDAVRSDPRYPGFLEALGLVE